MTFNELPDNVATTFVSGGLVFSGSTTWSWGSPGAGYADNGTTGIISGFGSGFTITRFGGGNFTLNQVDGGLSWYTNLTSHGVTAGSEMMTLNRSFQTFVFSSLVNVSSVTFSAAPGDGYYAFDNIVYDALDNGQVPEPASLMLIGLALAGLAAARATSRI